MIRDARAYTAARPARAVKSADPAAHLNYIPTDDFSIRAPFAASSPLRNYYGESDEAISIGLGRLAMTYQQAIGNGNQQVEAVSTGKTSHRGTYATAVPQWKAWFDALAK